MLNLFDKGMRNVVCTFGTSTISTENVSTKLMPYRVQGVEKIYIMYDGDNAGREAAKHIKPIIESDGFIVEVLELEEGTDPGDMSQESVDMMKEYTS
jgi:DNA primase